MSRKILTSFFLIVFCLVVLVPPSFAMSYTVKSGDTLFKIGQKFGISHLQIKKTNNLRSDTIKPGMRLEIPVANTYTVKRGDSLYLLSKKFGTTVANLKALNGLKTDKIIIGQKIRIPSQNVKLTTARGSSLNNISQADIQLLAKLVYGEARGESFTGQVAVASVVLNRVDSNEFPSTIKNVIFQPQAFTAVSDGQFNLTPNATAYQAVKEALQGYDPSEGALYYWNPEKATNKWIWSRPIHKKIGKHVFAY